ncbi:MAG: DUF4404 family protein [Polyangiales bacterium]
MRDGSRHYEGMPRQQLSDALKALHEELESAEEIEAGDREALLQAAREIQEALTRVESEPPEDETLTERMTALVEELESSYPRFAETLRNVSEALANLGI